MAKKAPKEQKSKGDGKGKKVNLKDFLKKANKFRETVASNASKGFEEFEDGSYVARATKLEIAPSSAGNMQAVTSWKFLEGEYRGKTKKAFQRLVNEDGWTYFLRDLRAMGFDIAQIDDFEADIPNIMKEVEKEKPVCRIKLVTNGDFQNVRINRLLDEDEVEDAESAEEEDDEEEDGDESEEESDDEEEESDDDDEEEDAEEEDEEEDEPKKKKGKAAKKKAAEEDEEEDEDEESDEEEESDDEEEDDEESEDEEESDDEEEDDSESVALSVGSRVRVKTKDGKKIGEVTEIFEDENAIKVTTEDGKKVKLPADRILEVLDTPDEPKKKTAKTADKGKKKAKK